MRTKLPTPSPGEPILADHIRKLSAAVRRLRPMTSSTVRVQETANGVAFHTTNTGGGSAKTIHPFKPTLKRRTSNTDFVTLEPGLAIVHADVFVPTIGGAPMTNTNRPELSLSGSSARWVYLEIAFTLNLSSGFVTGATASGATIEQYTSQQNSTSSLLRIPLFIWQREYPVIQWRFFNVSALARDDGSGSSTARWFIYPT